MSEIYRAKIKKVEKVIKESQQRLDDTARKYLKTVTLPEPARESQYIVDEYDMGGWVLMLLDDFLEKHGLQSVSPSVIEDWLHSSSAYKHEDGYIVLNDGDYFWINTDSKRMGYSNNSHDDAECWETDLVAQRERIFEKEGHYPNTLIVDNCGYQEVVWDDKQIKELMG